MQVPRQALQRQFNHWTKSEKEIKKPRNWDEAIKIAEDLASPFPFVRVDLYIINEKIYISEMTFTPAKGTLTFKDDESDFIIGKWLTIQKQDSLIQIHKEGGREQC